MIVLKRILTPTDFSPASESAIRYAVALGRAFHAQLIVLHVESRHDLEILVERELVVDRYLSEGSTDAPARNPARELLGRTLSEDETRDLRAEFVLRASGRGGPYVEIVRYAEEREIDLIVMGTHGHGFAAHMLMGSVAERVVRRAPCPVLTVRQSGHEFVVLDDTPGMPRN